MLLVSDMKFFRSKVKHTSEDCIIKIDCILFIHSYKAVSLLADCNLKPHNGHGDRLSSEKLAPAQWALLAGRRLVFWWIHYVPEQNRQTHPHGWRDAPRAGLAVTKPEGAVVPGNRRVELQLMPLFLEGRRTRKDVHWPYSQLVLSH